MAIKRRIVTTLPTTLAEGEEVYYRDPNGVQTLWVGNAQGEAWPSVGYKEWIGSVTQSGTSNPSATVIISNAAVVLTRDDVGFYIATPPSGTRIVCMTPYAPVVSGSNNTGYLIPVLGIGSVCEFITSNTALESADSVIDNGIQMIFRIYP